MNPVEIPVECEEGVPTASLTRLRALFAEYHAIHYCAELLYWDDRVYRPRSGAAGRAQKRAALTRLAHEFLLAPKMQDAVAAAQHELGDHPEVKAIHSDVVRALQLDAAHVEQREFEAGLARDAWNRARATGDLNIFLPHLQAVCDRAREAAAMIGYEREPYEAVLSQWEPGVDCEWFFGQAALLRAELHDLLPYRPQVERVLLAQPLSSRVRTHLESALLERIGFDAGRGVLEPSSRAFCITVGPDDVRMTTRFHETPYLKGIHSTLHEAGHAIYAQGFSRLAVPLALAEAPGLGIDESQARLYENNIGRSKPFIAEMLNILQAVAPAETGSWELGQLYQELNTAEHSAMRLGTDEISYNLHIIIRSELERALINGDLEVADLEGAWNAAYERELEVTPPDVQRGVLQDVHWSLGQWGYFPTYMLGNMYAAQLLETAARDGISVVPQQYPKLQAWLDTNVYQHGRSFTSMELVARASGEAVTVEPLLRYLRTKFTEGSA